MVRLQCEFTRSRSGVDLAITRVRYAGMTKAKKGTVAGKMLEDSALAEVFGIEMAGVAAPKKPVRRSTATATKLPSA